MNDRPFLPVAPLMIEHRLIERMIEVMRQKTKQAEETSIPDVRFIDAAVDFIRTYADRLHHGKEEGILFRDLTTKPLSEEHRRTMDELVAEHAFGRETTTRLVEAKSRYVEGEAGALTEIIDCFFTLTDFYPKHIEKEDRHFFLPVLGHFSREEQDRMLAEEREFDRRFVHGHYGNVVKGWEKDAGPGEVPGL
ncbi:hemerythrin domain-containing protein [candidate division WOR-3 bacterium]|nr:hemerythrin domain-containing protein [candidate division WOR-3 bacterium]